MYVLLAAIVSTANAAYISGQFSGTFELHFEDKDLGFLKTPVFNLSQTTTEPPKIYTPTTSTTSKPIVRRTIGKFRNATIEELPYQIFLEAIKREVGNFSYICGGVIISREYVITAAYCVESKTFLQLRVRAGTSIISEGGSEHKIDQVIIHEDYRSFIKPRNDIALLRVNPPFVFDETRQPIGLYPNGEKSISGEPATTTGWGYDIRPPGRLPSQLQTVDVAVVDNDSCNKAFKVMSGIFIGQICAGLVGEKDRHTCHIDPGNPLVINGRLAGVVSWGYRCWKPDLPTVYSEIAYYRDWIKKYSGV